MQTTWTMAKVWNESLGTKPERLTVPRQNIWASELGKADIDIYLKLKGVEPTNKPNARSKRKFEAGDIWEWVVKIILIRAGIYQTSQERVASSIQGMLEVTGKLDHIAGGMPNYDTALDDIKALELPEGIQRGAEAILEHFKTNYPNGLDQKIIEVKSLSSFAMDKVERTEKPINGHDLQCFHYVQNKRIEGSIVYVCRDDARMYECPILVDQANLLERYTAKIAKMTEYYNNEQEPEKEQLINFDKDDHRFSKNFNVEYSSYLTMLYGFEEPADYDAHVTPLIGRWNRVLGRVRAGKKLTANNEQSLAEMREHGFDADAIIASIPVTGEDESDETLEN